MKGLVDLFSWEVRGQSIWLLFYSDHIQPSQYLTCIILYFSSTDDQQLRILELNSWQLLRLLQVQIPGLSCGSLSCDVPSNDQWPGITECNGSDEEMLCCLFANAVVLHKSWKSKRISWQLCTTNIYCLLQPRKFREMLMPCFFYVTYRSNCGDEYHMTVLAYDNFLGAASKWLSGRATYVCVSSFNRTVF